MKIIATAKLRRPQENAEKRRPYSEKMNNIILNLSSRISDKENSPRLLTVTREEKTHLCVVMTSDRSLCRAFYTNIIKKAWQYFHKILKENKILKIITVGSKGYDQLKRQY
jgi:F0F1-type ATP synthase, gamma subunit